MVFRITNMLAEEDYREIVETLSDKKALDDEERRHFHYHSEDIAVKILSESELDIPLARLGERFSDGQISTSDAETYRVRMDIEYESRENNFPAVFEAMKGSVPKVYTANFGKKTVDLAFTEGFSYRVSCIGANLSISTIREKKIDIASLKADIESVILIVEWVVNTVYEVAKSDIELELTTKLRKRRVRSDLVRRRKWENAIRLEKPEMTFKDIGGCSEAKTELTMLGHGLEKPDSFLKWGIRYPRGILLQGPPGTGKTMLVRAMANLGKASLFCVSVTDVLTCWYGESPRLISKVFETAQKNAPSIILFDEIDSLLQSRSEAHEETVRVVSVFLQKMDGIKGMDKVIVIGTTNRLENIDHAMLRPGRFDKIIEVPPPDKEARGQIFRLHCAGKRIEPTIDYEKLANKSEEFTGADISEVIQIGLGKKLREELDSGNPNLPPLTTEDLLGSIEEYEKRRPSRALNEGTKINSAMYA